MRKLLSLLLLVSIFYNVKAVHIAGGELYYKYLGPGTAANTSRYEITMRLLRDCFAPSTSQGLLTETVNIGIYNAATLQLNTTLNLPRTFDNPIPFIQNTRGANLCLNSNIVVCYQFGIYRNTIDLPNTADGYVLSWTRFSRMNLINGVNPLGAIYTTKIPGTNLVGMGINNSPKFYDDDTAVVCFSSRFVLNFGATDPDGDSLSFEFCDAYSGGDGNDPNPAPTTSLSLPTVSYASGFSGSAPLGSGVTINSRTGVISGRSPATVGPYVICVCVTEWRNGVAINQHRKDFIVQLEACNLPSAELQQPGYLNCKSFTQNFENLSMSPNIIDYKWSFGEPFRGSADSSTMPITSHTYLDTGTYIVRLQIRNNTGCVAEDTSVIRVFPGLKANFTTNGICVLLPYTFTNTSTNIYGKISSYKWDFGEPTVNTDTSSFLNASYVYPTSGSKNVQMIVSNTKGCSDTAKIPLAVIDRPLLNLPFKDTLICSIDTLPLRSNSAAGVITWTPNSFISNTTINNPLVFPKDTTVYKITLNVNGCINTDSITVNVLDFITVDAGPDTSICITDTISLRPVSHALSYVWTPNIYLDNNLVKFPKSSPRTHQTKYYVTANLGKCQDRDSVTIVGHIYPKVVATGDANICFGSRTPLGGSIVANRFSWSPTSSLINPTSLNPIAGPTRNTNYVLTVNYDTGCLKSVRDTATVNVVPLFTVNAGRDTFAVVNQPLQLNATVNDASGKRFTWFPTTGLSNPNISNPVGTYNGSVQVINYLVTATTPENCISTDSVRVRVFLSDPEIFVPTGFTPNNDGRNETIKPICVGITSLDYFNIYNRLGQLIFTTNQIGKGWDGTFAGINQQAGTYVYMVKATDYLGKSITKQGTIVLIR